MYLKKKKARLSDGLILYDFDFILKEIVEPFTNCGAFSGAIECRSD
jgi:hypothetical protein